MAEHETPTAAEVEEFVKGITFPAKSEDLLAQAEENGASEDPRAMRFFEWMPAGKEFDSVTDVSKQLHSYKQEQAEVMDDMDEAA
jgi:hypothetical protein